MLPIYLYAEHELQLDQYRIIVNNILFMEDYDAYLAFDTTDSEQLIHELFIRITNGFHNEALFIIELNTLTSCTAFQLASKIRSLDTRGFIVLITPEYPSTELAFQYRIEALDIIPKNESWNLGLRINQCIQESICRSISHHSHSLFSFTSKNNVIQIPSPEILYITAVAHKLTLVTIHQTYDFFGTLSNCLEKLDEHFLFCHRAFIVNTTQIASIDKQNLIITFHNGQTCIASVRGMRRLLKHIEKTK